MSITSEIERIKTNIANAYNKANEKGATLPSNQNSANLASTIESITSSGDSTTALEANWWNTRTKNNTDWTGLFFRSSINTLDSSIDSSTVTNLRYAFYSSYNTNIPNLDFSNVVDAEGAFENSYITELPDLNLNKVTNMSDFIRSNSSLTKVGNLNTSMCKKFNGAFAFCSKLTTIRGINLSAAISDEASSSYKNPLYQMFYYSTNKLQNITFNGSINASLDLSSCPELTYASIMSAINALGKTETPKTLTLGSTNMAKLAATDQYIATSKGWTLA